MVTRTKREREKELDLRTIDCGNREVEQGRAGINSRLDEIQYLYRLENPGRQQFTDSKKNNGF
jgi:hypothetical protein